MKPKVSVLLAVYNGQDHLAEALESIQAQSMPHWELIAVDDGSSDDSARILESFAAGDARIRILSNPENLGLAASLNRGLMECRAEFVARQDADDISYPRPAGDANKVFGGSPPRRCFAEAPLSRSATAAACSTR